MSKSYPGGIPLVAGAELTATQASAKMKLGTLRQDDEGNIFRYVKANEALTAGDVVTPVVRASWDGIDVNGAHASGVSSLAVNGSGSALTANQYAGYYVSQATAAGLGKSYQIKSHPAVSAGGDFTVVLEEATEESFADTAELFVYSPFVMEQVDAATEIIKGVVLVDIASGSYGFVQVSGFVPAVKCGHSTSAAIVVNEPLVPLGTPAAAVQGFAASTPAESDFTQVHASPLISLRAVSANTTGFVEAFMRMSG